MYRLNKNAPIAETMGAFFAFKSYERGFTCY